MRKRLGPTLEIEAPTGAELEWIFAAMQRPEIYLPLSLPAPPTRLQVESGRLPLVDTDGNQLHSASYLLVRRRRDDRPVAFLLHYGWEHPLDKSRELDIAVVDDDAHSLGMFLEVHVLAALYLFGNGVAKRLRWRVALAGDKPLRWYGRLGAHSMGALEEPHPVTGAPQQRHVYELTKGTFVAVLERAGVRLEDDCDAWGVPLSRLLRLGGSARP